MTTFSKIKCVFGSALAIAACLSSQGLMAQDEDFQDNLYTLEEADEGDVQGNGWSSGANLALPNGALSVLVTNDDGTQQPFAITAGDGSPYLILVGDFTGNGVASLVAIDYNNTTAQLLIGIGDGSFLQGPLYAISDLPQDLLAQNILASGNVSLAVASGANGEVDVAYNVANPGVAESVSDSILDTALADDATIDFISVSEDSYEIVYEQLDDQGNLQIIDIVVVTVPLDALDVD